METRARRRNQKLISASIMPALKLHELPIEVLAEIVTKLNLRDVLNLILTCKALKVIILNDNGIWRAIGQSRFVIQDRGKSKTSHQSWYDRCRISHNWCRGRFIYKNIVVHRQNFMPWLKYHQSEVLLVTVGSDLHCYSKDVYGFPNERYPQWKISMPLLKRPDKRSDDISRFVVRDNLLACGNRNGSAAVYKIDDVRTRPKLQYIDNCLVDSGAEVSCVEIINDRDAPYLVTGSITSNVVWFRSWDCDQPGLRFRMKLENKSTEKVKCLALNTKGDRLAIGPDGNSKPMLADINRVQFLIKSEATSDVFQIVQDIVWHDENTLCYITHRGRLQLMDIRTEAVVYETRDPFGAAFYCVKTDGKNAIVAGCGQHARCVLYDVRKPRHVQLYFTQDKWKLTPIYSLDFDSSMLIAAGARAVAALDFNVHSLQFSIILARDYSDCVYFDSLKYSDYHG